MDEVIEGGVWIPVVGICRHEKLGDFKLISYGAKADAGMSFVLGYLIPVSASTMATDALAIVLARLDSYRVWPAKTKLESEIGVMESRQLSKFVRDHKFVDVLKRDKTSIHVSPSHRAGRSWRGITGYMNEEIRLHLPLSQAEFFATLTNAFDLAT